MSAIQQVLSSFGGPPPATDPYFAQVACLLHFDGADGSTTFTDQTGKTWTASGNAQIDTAQSKFGGASGLFDGSGDYISTPNSADLEFLSLDFTVEGWVRVPSDPAGAGMLVGQWGDSNSSWFLHVNSSRRVGFVYSTDGGYNGSYDLISAANVAPAPGTWFHVAAVRSGAALEVFVDGVAVITHSIGTLNLHNGARATTVGGTSATNPFYLNGHVDELRITKGVARYTSNFTPATAAFPNS